MYHFKARVYSPSLGRFLQTDPAGYGAPGSGSGAGSLNLYAYAGNDPINRIDPTGMLEEIVVTAPRLGFPWWTPYVIDFGNVSFDFSLPWPWSVQPAPEPQPESEPETEDEEDENKPRCLPRTPVNDTAFEAISKFNPMSTAIDREIGGIIYRDFFGLGSYRYNHVVGAAHDVIIPDPLPWQRKVGEWHTHGAESFGYADNVFSPGDIESARESGVSAFLGTPDESLLKYDPRTDTVKSFDDLKGVCDR